MKKGFKPISKISCGSIGEYLAGRHCSQRSRKKAKCAHRRLRRRLEKAALRGE